MSAQYSSHATIEQPLVMTLSIDRSLTQTQTRPTLQWRLIPYPKGRDKKIYNSLQFFCDYTGDHIDHHIKPGAQEIILKMRDSYQNFFSILSHLTDKLSTM